MFGINKVLSGLSELKSLLIQTSQETKNHLQSVEDKLESKLENKLEAAVQPPKTEKDPELESLSSGLKEVHSIVEKLQTEATHHDMAIEDMLESWEEFQQNQEQLQKDLLTRTDSQTQLLELCAAYEQQLHSIRQIAKEDPAWEKQLRLIDSLLDPFRTKAGFHVTGAVGETVDFTLHEILSAEDTDDKERNGRIETVYEPGICWHGQVYKKAKVGVWRFSHPEAS